MKFPPNINTFPTTVEALDGSGSWILIDAIDAANGDYIAEPALPTGILVPKTSALYPLNAGSITEADSSTILTQGDRLLTGVTFAPTAVAQYHDRNIGKIGDTSLEMVLVYPLPQNAPFTLQIRAENDSGVVTGAKDIAVDGTVTDNTADVSELEMTVNVSDRDNERVITITAESDTAFTIQPTFRIWANVIGIPTQTPLLNTIYSMDAVASLSTPLGTQSGILLGQLFYDTNNTPTPGKLFQGQTYSWDENPKLKAKFDSQGHGFITDNGTTFTIASHSDFIRAGTTAIGTHVNDTTARNSLRLQVDTSGSPVEFAATNTLLHNAGNTWQWAGDGVDILNWGGLSAGDAETAPDHRKAYFGIYGDLAIAVVDPDLVPVEDSEVVLIDTEGVNNTFYAFSTGETWAQVKANYTRLIVTGNVSQSGASNIRPYSRVIDLNSRFLEPYETSASGSDFQFDSSLNGVNVWAEDPSDSDLGFTYRQSGGDNPANGRMAFRVVAQKATKTIVAPTNTSEIDTGAISVAPLFSNLDTAANYVNFAQVTMPAPLQDGDLITYEYRYGSDELGGCATAIARNNFQQRYIPWDFANRIRFVWQAANPNIVLFSAAIGNTTLKITRVTARRVK